MKMLVIQWRHFSLISIYSDLSVMTIEDAVMDLGDLICYTNLLNHTLFKII